MDAKKREGVMGVRGEGEVEGVKPNGRLVSLG